MDYIMLAALWNGPARAGDLGAAVSQRTGQSVSPAVIDCYLRLFENWGFVERADAQSRYRLAERGSHYLAHIA
jgi:DNA-binding PadR family transcriptional regulator